MPASEDDEKILRSSLYLFCIGDGITVDVAYENSSFFSEMLYKISAVEISVFKTPKRFFYKYVH